MDKEAIRGKRRARKLLLQALYQWQMSKTDMTEIDAQFQVFNNMQRVDMDYYKKILYGIPKALATIEATFSPYLDRNVNELNPIELAVLRLGTFELLFCLETPSRVILDESVLLSKEFGSQDGHRYVNGVLHHVAHQVRAIEMKATYE